MSNLTYGQPGIVAVIDYHFQSLDTEKMAMQLAFKNTRRTQIKEKTKCVVIVAVISLIENKKIVAKLKSKHDT